MLIKACGCKRVRIHERMYAFQAARFVEGRKEMDELRQEARARFTVYEESSLCRLCVQRFPL